MNLAQKQKSGLKLFAILALIFAVGACNEPNPKLVAVAPRPPQDKVKDEGEKVLYNPTVDILFVIDNSGSMDQKQRNLAANVNLFTSEIQKYTALDFHIGVVTSTMYGGWGGRSKSDGRLTGNPIYVDRNTPDLVRTLGRNLIVGVDGNSTEEFFTPVRAALSPPLVNVENAGFYRPDAYLLVIFITDGEDLSSMQPDDLYKLLLGMKQNDKAKIITNGVVIPTNVMNCDRSGELPPRKIEQFLKLSGGTMFGLCDVDYGQKLANLGKLLVERIGNSVLLTRAPLPETIEVKFGTQIVPNSATDGWMYDPARNAVVFASGIKWTKQPQGTTIEVTFTPADPVP